MRHPCRHLALFTVALLGFALAAAGAADPALPQLPSIPDRTFNIKGYHPAADGRTLDTRAIARAIDAASEAGGGTLHFPAGTYLTGAVRLRSHVRIDLAKGARLIFSTDPADYPVVLTRWEATECMNYCGLISAEECATDIAITGSGTIDGQGAAWWKWTQHARPAVERLRQLGQTTTDPRQRVFGTPEAGLRPCLFEPVGARRVLIEGVTFTNSPMWTIHPVYCTDFTARKLTVHGTGPNTDGLDPDSCSGVLIEDCMFDTGDDCIAIKSGRDRDGRRVGKPTENVTVRRCVFQRGHGTVVIGSEMSGGVRNVLAVDCTADGTDNAVRLKTRFGRGGTVENITYRNFNARNILKYAITIDMLYEAGPNPTVAPEDEASAIPVFRNIGVENLTCDHAAHSILIRGLPQSPIRDVTLKNVSITADSPAQFEHVEGLVQEHVDLKVIARPGTD